MTSARRFQLDEVTLRPGTYFNPQTEVMIIVDDSPEVDHEIFESEELDSSDWVLIAEDIPLDENKRDELVERFQRAHQDETDLLAEHDDEDLDEEDEDDEEGDEDEDDELDGVDDLEFDHE
ncbi:MAG TPA: hypothetical protein VKG82_11590 [Solirubrobacteraceae bacterium]|nr:hypothetical protein [Solirubrobacteraceae bacterium]